MKQIIILFIGFCSIVQLNAQQVYSNDNPLAHTYSIVARDTLTGEMGVAVQSHWFSVGTIVSWAEAGVGVVATQSFVNPSFGPRGLELMKNGLPPKMAMQSLLELDEGREVRQLAMLDKHGNVHAFTGADCIEAAGHFVGNNFAVQANMMDKNTVWPAMAKAFENSSGNLAERMLAAMEAAQNEGGDIRGSQSVAILVVKANSTGNLWEDRVVDLHLADHPEPLKEMKRLLNVHKAYEFMNKGDLAMETGDFSLAKSHYENAQKLNPENLEMKYWYAITLLNNNEIEKAKPLLKFVFDANDNWRRMTPRLMKPKLLLISEEQLDEILKL